MKVKTFTGSETAKVDKRVNDWLAQFVVQRHGLGVLHHAKAPVLAGLDGEHAARSKRVGIPRAILAVRGRHGHKRSGSHAADSENQPP